MMEHEKGWALAQSGNLDGFTKDGLHIDALDENVAHDGQGGCKQNTKETEQQACCQYGKEQQGRGHVYGMFLDRSLSGLSITYRGIEVDCASIALIARGSRLTNAPGVPPTRSGPQAPSRTFSTSACASWSK